MSASLFDPFSLGSLELKNRIVLAPMTRARAGEDRIPNDVMAEYYRQRSSAGLLVTEGTTISEQANGWTQSPGIYTDAMQSAWSSVTETVHEANGKIFVQLWHTGRASHSDFHGGEKAVAPSAIKIEGDGIHTPEGKKEYEVPRALETDKIPRIVEDYAAATKRARAAGFDGVEIHSANGYLIDEFLQSKTNHRDDKYGGSIEERFQFLKEVVEATSAEWSSDRVGVRLSPNGAFNDMGSPDYREQFQYVAAELEKFGLAYLHVLDGLAFGFHELGEPVTLAELRKFFTGTLIGNCGYDLDDAKKRLADGDADLIAFGRPYISNPDLVERFRNDWPLADDAEQSVWYSHTGAEGYTDFPTYQEQ